MHDSFDNEVTDGDIITHYSRRILNILSSQLAECTSYAALARCCETTTRAIGAEHYVYHNYLPVADETNSMHNMQAMWIRLYRDKDYAMIDPRLMYCTINSEPILWSDIQYADKELGRQQRNMMKEAEIHGMGDGITIPVHAAGSEIGILSFSAAKGRLPHYTPMDTSLLSLFAHKLHMAFHRLRATELPPVPERVELTEREKQCMLWTVEGKTSWEISQILGCSESSVAFHVRRVIQKLDVNNRAQAVGKVVGEVLVLPFGHLDGRPLKMKSGSLIRIKSTPDPIYPAPDSSDSQHHRRRCTD